MSRIKVWARRIAITAGIVLLIQQAWRHGRDYVFADQFAEIVPGKVFRGAWQQPWPMKRIIRNHQIKTIVALAHPPDHPLVVREKALAKQMGCQWIHIPIVDDRAEGDGRQLLDKLEKAAQVIADPANQPVYFHCHHGINRASMAQIAFRTLSCGWTLDEATDEVARTFGLVAVNHGPDYRHMKVFYDERVLPRRLAQAEKKPPQTR